MSLEDNKQVVRELYGSLSAGSTDGFIDRLTDDVRWTFIGTHRFGRTFNGKDDIKDNLFGVLGKMLTAPIKIHIKTLVAEGDYVVMEAEGESDTNTGETYNNSYLILLTLRNRKVAEMREYLDTELITKVFGRPT